VLSFTRPILPLFLAANKRPLPLFRERKTGNRKLAAKASGSVLGNAHGAVHFPIHLILELWRYAGLTGLIPPWKPNSFGSGPVSISTG